MMTLRKNDERGKTRYGGLAKARSGKVVTGRGNAKILVFDVEDEERI